MIIITTSGQKMSSKMSENVLMDTQFAVISVREKQQILTLLCWNQRFWGIFAENNCLNI